MPGREGHEPSVRRTRVTGLVTTEELRLALLRARLRTSQLTGNGR